MPFEVSFSYSFEAAHRFTKSCSKKCMTPHGHSWKAELVFENREQSSLNESQMFEEFSLLKQDWKYFIQETVDHSFFHAHDDPIISHLRDLIPDFRGLPFPGDPTTELISFLFFKKAESLFRKRFGSVDTPLRPAKMVIQETKTNGVIYQNSEERCFPAIDSFDGWWNSSDYQDRRFEIKK